MSGQAARAGALLPFTLPPYWMRVAVATAADTFVESQLRMNAWTS